MHPGRRSPSTFAYFPPDKLVSAQSLALGSAPTESTWGEGDKHRGITHAWRDFALLNYDPVVGGETLNCPNSSFSVAARGNSDRTYSARLDAPDPLGAITEFWAPSADWGA